MRKNIFIGMVVLGLILLSGIVFAQVDSKSNQAGPLQSLLNSVQQLQQKVAELFNRTDDLQGQIKNIELLPGPKGEKGDMGLEGPKGDTGEVNVTIEHNLGDLAELIRNGGETQQRSFFDIFVKIGDIKGESNDASHKDWVDVLSYSHGMTNMGSETHGGESGKPSHEDFVIVKKLDKSSPKLYEALNTGEHIPEVRIELIRKGEAKQKFMEYKLTDVLITSTKIEGDTSETAPVEQVSFSYSKIEWIYTPQKEDGSSDASIKTGWDLKLNKQV